MSVCNDFLFLGLLFAVAAAQRDGGRRCPSPESISTDGCRVECIHRDRMSEEGCSTCNQTCNAMCPEFRCSLSCPNGYQQDRRGCQICNCTQSNQLDCLTTVLSLSRRCKRECIKRNDDECFYCDMACNNETTPMMMGCEQDEDCSPLGVCASVGVVGIQRCLNMTGEGGMCEPDDDDDDDDDDDNSSKHTQHLSLIHI